MRNGMMDTEHINALTHHLEDLGQRNHALRRYL